MLEGPQICVPREDDAVEGYSSDEAPLPSHERIGQPEDLVGDVDDGPMGLHTAVQPPISNQIVRCGGACPCDP